MPSRPPTPETRLLPARAYADFYDRLGRGLRSGLPLGRSLRQLAGLPPRLRAVVEAATAAVESGAPLGETLGRHPDVILPHEAAAIMAAEEAGRLPQALERLGAAHRARHERETTMRLKLVYPATLTAIAVLALPLKHLITGGFSAYAAHAAPNFLLLVGGALTVWLAAQSPAARAAMRRVGLALPVVGTWLTEDARARVLDVAGHAYTAGLTPVRCFETAAGTVQDAAWQKACTGTARRLGKGRALSAAMAAFPDCFPARVIDQVRAGEEAGAVDAALLVAAAEAEEAALRAEGLTTALAASLATALAMAVVGWQVVSQVMEQLRQVQEQLGL